MKKNKVVLFGGSGFLGGVLSKALLEKNYEVVVVSRSVPKIEGVRHAAWDGETLGEWHHAIRVAIPPAFLRPTRRAGLL